jgi:hypothetical protein
MTEDHLFAYAMLAWCCLMVGTLLVAAWHLANPFPREGCDSAKTAKPVEAEGSQPDPKDAP